MTTLHISTNLVSNAAAVVNLDLGGYDAFVIDSTGSVNGNGAATDGIISTALGVSGTIDGWVYASRDGVSLAQGADAITVLAGGQVSGRRYALNFGAGEDKIVNRGILDGNLSAIQITDGAKTAGNTIVNSGVIESPIDNMTDAIMITGGGGNVINNSGVISGNVGIGIHDIAGDAPDTIVNSGVIIGTAPWAFWGGNAKTTLTNTGQIFGDVMFGAGADNLINKGSVHGPVHFFGGGSKYDGSQGVVTGWVYVMGGGGVFTGGAGADKFEFDAAALGAAVIQGGGGNDQFAFTANLKASAKIDGGAGSDTVSLKGDYSAGLTFGATTMVNVETLQLWNGDSYTLTANDSMVAAGRRLTVDARKLTATDSVSFNAAAETNGAYAMLGGAGADTFVFKPAHFSSVDVIKGGAGAATDTLRFLGAGTIAASAFAKTSGIETIALANGANSVALNAAMVASANAATLTVQGGTGVDTINASAVTAATSTVRLDGAGGADMLTAGGAKDVFVYTSVADSTGANYDTIAGANLAIDRFQVSSLAGVVFKDPTVTGGKLSSATFNADLAAAIGPSKLAAHDGLVFKPSTGTLAGDTFLVVDVNALPGYQANADLVIRLTGATGTLTSANFV